MTTILGVLVDLAALAALTRLAVALSHLHATFSVGMNGSQHGLTNVQPDAPDSLTEWIVSPQEM